MTSYCVDSPTLHTISTEHVATCSDPQPGDCVRQTLAIDQPGIRGSVCRGDTPNIAP
ncbi:hypothetical protein CSKR_104024 [Clonorchis sinensis]|uniref:Uncharacterized protein n=1 Tax=Clonorchis sinensis TaxID=79923 RepID=A0A419QBA0_CLOSI|nr:hypothetical protein CSKR_104024 [Clonorchis sinensis]